MTRGLFAAVVLVSAACAQPKTDRFPIEKIDLQGTVFPKAAVLPGLTAGEVVAPADFNAAAKKLKESGLFQNVEFRYGPGPANGYVLSFEITDFPELTPASIEVPEVNEDSIWKCAAERYAVVPKRVPADEAAERLYTAAIQQCLVSQGHSEEIVRRMSSSSNTARPRCSSSRRTFRRSPAWNLPASRPSNPRCFFRRLARGDGVGIYRTLLSKSAAVECCSALRGNGTAADNISEDHFDAVRVHGNSDDGSGRGRGLHPGLGEALGRGHRPNRSDAECELSDRAGGELERYSPEYRRGRQGAAAGRLPGGGPDAAAAF